MTQIKENQIISSPIPERNPVVSPPRDLAFTVVDNDKIVGNATSSAQSVISLSLQQTTNTEVQTTNYTGDIAAIQNPATPAILSVKSQVVNMQDDGTSTINAVLVVQDIPGVIEYDIRIAPIASSL